MMKLMSAVACATAVFACTVAMTLPASAAVRPPVKNPPTRWTVEYKVGGDVVFAAYDYPQQHPPKLSIPLTLNPATMKRVDPRDLARALLNYRIAPADTVNVMLFLPRAAPPGKPRLYRMRWLRTPVLETGFGGAARSVAKHFPKS
jgi:hypothetical protein